MYICTGAHITDYLGDFNFKSLWNHEKLYGLTFHAQVLDKLTFSYMFALKGKHTYLIAYHQQNRNSTVHVKSDLIATSHPNEFGNLAICTIPGMEEENISFTPPKLIWRPLRGLEIEMIKFCLTDEHGHLLNYSGVTLLFVPTESITF